MSDKKCPSCGGDLIGTHPGGWRVYHTEGGIDCLQRQNAQLREILILEIAGPSEAAVRMCQEIYAGNCVHRVKGVETIIGRVARKARQAAAAQENQQ